MEVLIDCFAPGATEAGSMYPLSIRATKWPAVDGVCEEACVEHLCCVGRNQPVQVISSRHQYGKGFRYTQKIDRLDMHRMAQSLEGGLQKTFALRRMGMDRCSDVLEPRAHLERQAETSRQFRNPGAHSLNAE